MIPGLNDAELESILEAAAKAGARHAGYILAALPHELKAIFVAWLQEHFPDRAGRVLELIRQTRAGALSDAKFGRRFTGTGVYADLLARRFARAVKQLGLLDEGGLDAHALHPSRGRARPAWRRPRCRVLTPPARRLAGRSRAYDRAGRMRGR